MAERLSKAFVDQIKKEHQQYLADPDVLHNRELHDRIQKTWKQESPLFHRRMQEAKLLEPLAYVAQQRMWQEQEKLVRSGMAWPDAREQAERMHLMLDPDKLEESSQPTPTQ